MITRALPLALCLAAAPAQACVERSLTELSDSDLVRELTFSVGLFGLLGADWDIYATEETLDATCFNCGDERSFVVIVLPLDADSLAEASTLMDGFIETFCAGFESGESGLNCTAIARQDMGELPGASAETDGISLGYTEVVYCQSHAIIAQAFGTEPSDDLLELSQGLRPMIRLVLGLEN